MSSPKKLSKFFSVLIVTVLVVSCDTGSTPDSTKTKTIRDSSAYQANLYLQSAAEFAILSRQVYENASQSVIELSKKQQGEKPFAVVMDLDETVVDNSAYQNHLFNENEDYNRSTWDAFVKDGAEQDSLITLVPGVYDFINLCKTQNIQVVFISNRMNSTRKETAITLAKLGLDTLGLGSNDSKLMLLRTDTGNKDARRDTVRKYFDTRIFIGDNISDFTSELDELGQIERREVILSEYADKIGKSWFLIPNPAYGDWTRGIELRNADYTIPR